VRISKTRSFVLAAELLVCAAIAMSSPAKAQKQEIGLTIGGLSNPDRNFHDLAGTVQSSSEFRSVQTTLAVFGLAATLPSTARWNSSQMHEIVNRRRSSHRSRNPMPRCT
jgi:hypothetical protein